MSLNKFEKIAAVLTVIMIVTESTPAINLRYKLHPMPGEDIALANIVGALSTSVWRSIESNVAMRSNG